MVVALEEATGEGLTLFGQNSHRPSRECQALQRVPGRDFALGEKVRTQFLELPQARKTCTVLAGRAHGFWGYHHGLNEHQLALGCATLRTRLPGEAPGLLGPDLVRLVLERCRSARQAVDLLVDLVERHGQGPFPGCPEQVEGDQAFLIADASEAFAVETTGHYWVMQEIGRARAVSDVSVIRQDWDRIARGLAGRAIEQGWWPGDGTKLDFAGALSTAPTGLDAGLRRWGRATLLLEVQSGHVDAAFLRRLLADHYEGTRDEVGPQSAADAPRPLCRHATPGFASATAASVIAPLRKDPGRLPLLWCAFGPPCRSIYFPVFLDGELPALFTCSTAAPDADCLWWQVQQLNSRAGGNREARERLEQLQQHLDREAESLAADGARLKQQGNRDEVYRRTTLFMEHALEQWKCVASQLEAITLRVPARKLTTHRT
jgi:dipeptidase